MKDCNVMLVNPKSIAGYAEIENTKVILDFPTLFEVTPHYEELKSAFRDILNLDSGLMPGASSRPPIAPRIGYRSKNSTLVLSNLSAAFEVNYFGNFKRNYELCHQYLAHKLDIISRALVKAGLPGFYNLACVTELSISFGGLDTHPVEFLHENFLPVSGDPSYIQDIQFRVGFKEDDRYFLNFNLSNYYSYEVKQPVTNQITPIRLADAIVTDQGIKISVDVNTKLLQHKQSDINLSPEDISLLLDKSKESIETKLPDFLSGKNL